jgi:D-lactate dehydrogenase (cytochrome)
MNHPIAFAESLRRPIPEALAGTLRERFGSRFSTAQAVRDHHGRDESPFPPTPPEAVVYAQSTDEVVEIVNLCRRHRYPLIPYGAGSSLEGHVLAIHGGVSIDLSQMNRVLAVDAEDLTATVQAGVLRKQLNEELKSTGLFFPIDPGADASIGGMSATRASGTNAVRYGTMRENVLGLTVVTADGKVIRTANRAKKSSAGYDLTRLFIGSEGTLGVITEVTVRLYPVPEAMSAAVVNFASLADAVGTVIETIQLGVPIARSEFLCDATIRAINAYSKTSLRELPTLFFEFHGTERGVEEQARMLGAIAAEYGGGDFQWTTRQEERNRLWQARHDAYYAALALRPGCKGWATDVCVPISRLADCILETRRDVEASGLVAPLVGHVGDGNFHLVFLVDPDDPEEMARASAVNDRMVVRAIDMGGTCTGEHGVGYGKMGFLKHEHGEALSVMRAVKQALDPQGIMNPGKIV